MSGKEKASILDILDKTDLKSAERTPLIGAQGHGNGSSNHQRGGSFAKFRAVLAAEGEPSYLKSFRWIIFGSFVFFLCYLREPSSHPASWWNVLLVFVPLSIISHHLDWDAALRFSFSFFAIMPLAKVRVVDVVWPSPGRLTFAVFSRLLSQLLGEATDQLSIELGQTLGALLNASFGNAVEIIVGIAALLQGEEASPNACRPRANHRNRTT